MPPSLASKPVSLPSLTPPTAQRPRGLARVGLALARLWAVARERCPRCREGRVFGGLISMNEHCATCGLRFGRDEPGYFLGAMYFSYGQGIVGIGGFLWLFALLLPTWSWTALVALAAASFLPFVPGVFRRSRTIWLTFDHFWDPA